MFNKFIRSMLLATLLLAVSIPMLAYAQQPVLNVYSSRHYGTMEAPFVAFQEATGIEVRVSAGTPNDLLERLTAEVDQGGRSVADVFLAIDAGVLELAAQRELLQPIQSDVLDANIPVELRDPEGYWYGLSKRIRTLVYNPANVTAEELASIQTYADLGTATWADRVCMRPASHTYTVALMSSLVFHLGEDDSLTAFTNLSNNVTRYINSDTSIITAVAAGECDVAFVNHYYLARLANGSNDDKAIYDAVRIHFMQQSEGQTGAFFNVNSAGVVVNAANYDNAVRFIEFMSQPEMQASNPEAFVGSNYEYPVNPEAELHPTLASWGEVKFDTVYPLWEYGNLQVRTIELLDEAGFGFTEN